jgi:NAD(P)-dependent dehydrogenase (short-subunit alcohol dehydrogenase family)
MKTLVIGAHTGGIGDAVLAHPTTGRTPDVKAPTLIDLDVTSEESIANYLRQHGPFDRVVYSAGVSRLSWVRDEGLAGMSEVMAVNTFGAVLMAAWHLELFPDHQVRYVVVVSDAAHTPMRGSIAYTMSKAALEMAVKSMARELAPGWIVVGVSPGVVDDTGMTNRLAKEIPEFRGWSPEVARAYEDSGSVLGRRVTKQEVARTIAFALDGPEALNGSIITINGGK